jgi:hypothetical protein
MKKEMLMKPWKRSLSMPLAVFTILSLLLSACGPVTKLRGNFNIAKDKIKEKLTESGNDNETDDDQDAGANKITICHKTGSAKHPYVEITISSNAAKNGHAKHQGDIIPAPKNGCPSTATEKVKDNDATENETDEDQDTGATKITICHKTGSTQHPYVEITISNDAAQNGHAKHQGDIIPAPKEGCPTAIITTSTPISYP